MPNPTSWSELTRGLVDVAMGRAPADLVVRGGRWVCVQSGEIVSGTDVAVKGQRIAYVGPDARHAIVADTRVIEAEGRYLVPGLLDGHMHFEMAHVTISEFVRAVLPLGTTGVFIDPHEFANVLGLPGVRLVVQEAAQQPIHVWVQMPSCVPAAPGLETSGALFGPTEVAEACSWPEIIGLGEMMNFPGVIAGDPEVHATLAAARAAGRPIGGHYASPDLGRPFHAYVAAGIDDDHEGTRLEDAVSRARQGLKTMLRFGSGLDDLKPQIRAITELGLDSRHFILATDGLHPGLLARVGHMDRVVRHAMAHGLRPMAAIQMATLNTAEHFAVARDAGQIAPGRFADLLLVDDLPTLQIGAVIARGSLAAQEGQLLLDVPAFSYPPEVKRSIRLPRRLTAGDFRVPAADGGAVTVNVIGMIAGQITTRHLRINMTPVDGALPADRARDLAKVAVVERYQGSGDVRTGFVHGFGLKAPCAIASSMAHDSHHLVLVGTDDANLALAANSLAEKGGGQVVVCEGRIAAYLELPIAGLLSEAPVSVVAAHLEALTEAISEQCGGAYPSTLTQVTRLALAVIPELRLSDLGLVDVTRNTLIPVVEALASAGD
ncbi:MAG: adenine deaminase [Anaerolineales bacterium]|nr:adenine deaminase [Anaerolineales bacterium]